MSILRYKLLVTPSIRGDILAVPTVEQPNFEFNVKDLLSVKASKKKRGVRTEYLIYVYEKNIVNPIIFMVDNEVL